MRHSFLTDGEQEFDRRLALLAGEPYKAQLWRGDRWELWMSEGSSYIPLTFSDERQPPPQDVFLNRVTSSNRSSYDPLRDTPDAFLVHAAFGEKVWRNGMVWNAELVEETVRMHETYGKLIFNDVMRLDEYWYMMRVLALEVLCYRSLFSDGLELRRQVVERILESEPYSLVLWDHYFGVDNPDRQKVLEYSNGRMKAWADYLATADLADHDSYVQRAGGWLNDQINGILAHFGVRTQVRYRAPEIWLPAYRTLDLIGALWSQLVSVILGGSKVRWCKNPRCIHEPLFSTRNPRKEYCSPKCKESSKKRRQRTSSEYPVH